VTVNSSRCGLASSVRPSAAMIRDVRENDAKAIAAIYGHHVLHGTASYDLAPPSIEDTHAKIRRIASAAWPFVVEEESGELAGYAYVTQFRDRAAYAWTCETSIYVHPQWLGRGIGKSLLNELCRRAEGCGFRQIVGVIGGAEPASIALHASCGFREVGRLRAVGWKQGRWLDNVYMQRELGEGSAEPPA
jgi:L-amino acid N-acyltransferase YncA